MDVIPFILSERDVEGLTDEMLDAIAQTSTEGVIVKIREYLDSDKHDPTVAARVSNAYKDAIGLRDYLKGEDVAKAVECISELTYDDINIGLSMEQLEKYQNAMKLIFDSKYAVPYISPVRKEAFIQARKILEQNSVGSAVSERMRRASNLFKDLPSAPAKGTPVKKVVRNRVQYEIMSRGISVIISRKKSNMTPNEWRYL